MIYLICQDWANTSNNHAGMKYLCNQLQLRFREEFTTIVLKDNIGKNMPKNKILRKAVFLRAQMLHKWELMKVYIQLKQVVHPGDTIILMEYMDLLFETKSFAYKLKSEFVGANLYAMVHLVPDKLNRLFKTNEDLADWVKPVDKILTLGSSLTRYFISRQVPEYKIATLFHYVDEYYMKASKIKIGEPPVAIAMGNQMRNVELLKQVVRENPNVQFIICQGLSDMSAHFDSCTNVRLVPFVEEPELRKLMGESDISINVMQDTIGSNVIATSLAMGLAMVCSDVGSIRDYCSEDSTIFCMNNSTSFSNAIQTLMNDKKRLEMMRTSSALSGKMLTIEKFKINLVALC